MPQKVTQDVMKMSLDMNTGILQHIYIIYLQHVTPYAQYDGLLDMKVCFFAPFSVKCHAGEVGQVYLGIARFFMCTRVEMIQFD